MDGKNIISLNASSSLASQANAEPGITFGPTLLTSYGLSRDTNQHECNPWPLQPLDSNHMVLHAMAVEVSSYIQKRVVAVRIQTLIGSSIEIQKLQNGLVRLTVGNTAMAQYWSVKMLWCCRPLCPSSLSCALTAISLIGNVQFAIAILCVMIFRAGFLMRKGEHQGQAPFSFWDIFNIAGKGLKETELIMQGHWDAQRDASAGNVPPAWTPIAPDYKKAHVVPQDFKPIAPPAKRGLSSIEPITLRCVDGLPRIPTSALQPIRTSATSLFAQSPQIIEDGKEPSESPTSQCEASTGPPIGSSLRARIPSLLHTSLSTPRSAWVEVSQSVPSPISPKGTSSPSVPVMM